MYKVHINIFGNEFVLNAFLLYKALLSLTTIKFIFFTTDNAECFRKQNIFDVKKRVFVKIMRVSLQNMTTVLTLRITLSTEGPKETNLILI